MEAGTEALHIRLDQLEHGEQFAVGEQHLAIVVGDADHGVQIVQRLDHELAMAQALLHHIDADGELVLGILQRVQQRCEVAGGVAQVQTLGASVADRHHRTHCLLQLRVVTTARPPPEPGACRAQHQQGGQQASEPAQEAAGYQRGGVAGEQCQHPDMRSSGQPCSPGGARNVPTGGRLDDGAASCASDIG